MTTRAATRPGGLSRGHPPALSLRALTRATELVAEGLTEDRLLPRLARCAAEAAGVELAAIYVQPNPPGSGNSRSVAWSACPCGAATADPSACCSWVRRDAPPSMRPR